MFKRFSKDTKMTSTLVLEDTECMIHGTGCTLEITVDEGMQPCLGSYTHIGMSYGRWSVVPCSCRKLTLDNIRVVLNSAVPPLLYWCVWSRGYAGDSSKEWCDS